MYVTLEFFEDGPIDLRSYGTWMVWKQDIKNGRIFDIAVYEGNLDYVSLRFANENDENILHFKKIKILKEQELAQKLDPSDHDHAFVYLEDLHSEEDTKEFQGNMQIRSCFVDVKRVSEQGSNIWIISRKLSAREQVEKTYKDLLDNLDAEHRKMLEEITDYWRRNGVEAKTRTSVS